MNAEASEVNQETQIDPNVETKARSLGWRPKEEWRGDPARWQDAATYAERAESFLPVIKAQNAQQASELQKLRAHQVELENDLKGAKEAIDTLQGFKGEVEERIETADTAVLARQLKEAREAGDTELELKIFRQLQTPQKEEKPKTPETAIVKPQPNPMDSEEGREFLEEYPWWGQEGEIADTAIGIGQGMARRGELTGLSPIERARKIAQAAQKIFALPQSGASKVESGRSSAATNVGDGEHSFADLPPDAREAMKRQAKYLVGPGKRFKTEAEWQKHYVASYFKDWGQR